MLEDLVYPDWYLTTITICLGLLTGSFLNVVVARLPHGQSVVKPRSRCPGCQKLIAWYDNVPVLSYLLLRGKCRKCSKSISIRYPVIELLTALLFLAVLRKFGWSWLLPIRDWPFVAILVAVTFIDLEHRIIPDELSLGGLVWGLLTAWFVPGLGLIDAAIGAAVGFGLFYGLAFSYLKLTGRSGLGGGDIKLLAMLGAFLGIQGVFVSIFVSSVFGSLAGIAYALANSRKAASGVDVPQEETSLLKVAIPYGPFLVVGALYFYLLHDILWLRFMIPT
jgi:leader peptidase (prepilin peptidase)/N-methyltransferase